MLPNGHRPFWHGSSLGCVVMTRKGYQRVCRDGPVFEADEMTWEGMRAYA